MAIDLAYRIVLLLVLGVGLGASATLRRRADRSGGTVPRSADEKPVALALGIGGALFYGSLLGWLIHPPLMGWASLPIPAWSRWLGAALLAGGVGVALWALRHLGRNTTPTAVARPDAELVTTGPYRHVRHPLYSSMLLTIPGCALPTANLLVLTAGAWMFAAIMVRLRREEVELVERFGELYVRYMGRTGGVLPRWRTSD